ncbi:MAG: DMT family transporter, partial [Gammaproteobacteria bacterium]|nr:DMT family transporter [Gammaproteobacteria bacterium]
RWAAVIAGFIGTLIILRPGGGEFSIASIAILFAACCYACQAIASRHLATESLLSLSVYVVAGPLLVAITLIDSESWQPLDLFGWLLMTGAAIGSVVAWVGFLNGYRQASPSVLAPFEYLAIIAGAGAGYVIWDEVPDIWVLVGALVIIASGLYVAFREIGQNDSGS